MVEFKYLYFECLDKAKLTIHSNEITPTQIIEVK